MPELLQHVLESLLRSNNNEPQQVKDHIPNISGSHFIVLDKAAPVSLLAHLRSHHAPHTLLSINEYLNLSQKRKILREPSHYKEPNGLIITQTIAANNQMALASLLSCAFINIPLILYTTQPTLTEAVSFIRAGIIDYWSESSEFSAIKASLTDLLITDRKRKYNRELFQEIRYRIETLTKREEQVIDLLLSTKEEMTNKKIGKYLELSPRTIEDYRANAMEKLAIDTKNELVLVWLISQQLKLPLRIDNIN